VPNVVASWADVCWRLHGGHCELDLARLPSFLAHKCAQVPPAVPYLQVERLQSEPVVFQSSRDSQTNAPLELPSGETAHCLAGCFQRNKGIGLLSLWLNAALSKVLPGPSLLPVPQVLLIRCTTPCHCALL